MKKLLLLTLLCIPMTGCMTANLYKDGAIVWAELNTPYGVQRIRRVGGTTNMVEIKPDGTIVINGHLANQPQPTPTRDGAIMFYNPVPPNFPEGFSPTLDGIKQGWSTSFSPADNWLTN